MLLLLVAKLLLYHSGPVPRTEQPVYYDTGHGDHVFTSL